MSDLLVEPITFPFPFSAMQVVQNLNFFQGSEKVHDLHEDIVQLGMEAKQEVDFEGVRFVSWRKISTGTSRLGSRMIDRRELFPEDSQVEFYSIQEMFGMKLSFENSVRDFLKVFGDKLESHESSLLSKSEKVEVASRLEKIPDFYLNPTPLSQTYDREWNIQEFTLEQSNRNDLPCIDISDKTLIGFNTVEFAKKSLLLLFEDGTYKYVSHLSTHWEPEELFHFLSQSYDFNQEDSQTLREICLILCA